MNDVAQLYADKCNAEAIAESYLAKIKKFEVSEIILREANVFITKKYDEALDAILAKYNKVVFENLELRKENAEFVKMHEAIKCGIDSRTSCTGCPECAA